MGRMKSLLYRLKGEVSTEDLVKSGLKIGKNFKRNEHCSIDQSHCWLIEIGDDVTFAPRVHVLAHDASMWQECGYTKIAPVRIGNNVFVGAGSIIMPGVTIGNNVVIGAGSIVTKDVESGCVVAGNPAKKIKNYDDFIKENQIYMRIKPCYGEEYTLRNRGIALSQKKEMKEALDKKKFGYVR